MTSSTFIALFVSLGTFLSVSAMSEIWKYHLVDSSANSAYPEGSVEWHCFDFDGSGRFYVRGTYGNFGYFEGKVVGTNAYVDWYEVTAGSMTPTTGTATLTYTNSYKNVTGPFWASGSSDLAGSYGTWNSVGGTYEGDEVDPPVQANMLKNCFYSGYHQFKARDQIEALEKVLDGESTAISADSDAGQNTFCSIPAGVPGGSWLGSYTYIYPDGSGTERGTYSTNPIGFWVRDGFGFVGNWEALTGPVAGNSGSNLYMVLQTGNTPQVAGFYCDVTGEAPNLARTACYSEYYEVSENENEGNCPSYYRLDNSLDSLYSFASVGSDESEDKYRDNLSIGTQMAVLFGCLSGVLIAVVIYLTVKLHQATAATTSA